MKIRCKKCNDIIEGDKKGSFIFCECREIGIDETIWYCRIVGKKEDYEEVRENENIKDN